MNTRGGGEERALCKPRNLDGEVHLGRRGAAKSPLLETSSTCE